ncbi:MAG: hypothetical protein DIZ77_09670 [endosymbiont of Seepiophila jonesi]|uniref:Acetyltransferase n=1 Tax=endosymbiont of Lamellibrachia luymesi TaxID=2200907 RepID=A0A370E1Y3_9GAMM|nr:MAG: hypothetical protein DIZ77_09670 [endosymbiont of Seepiophila jonesi]RDH92486.1 MAG: hypothetical protein DIZ79_03365 [endosymbiont of Lamellibrachia luymesi]
MASVIDNRSDNLNEMLRSAFHESLIVADFFDESYLNQGFKEIQFNTGYSNIIFSKGFGDNCQLLLSKFVQEKLQNGTVSLRIVRMGVSINVPDVFIAIGDFTGSITVLVGSSGTILIGNCGQLNLDLRIGHGSRVFIGNKTTSNGARIVAINSLIALKRDVMLSDEILIQGFDQHGIIDLKSRDIINQNRKKTIVGRHVWVGRRATLMPGVSIGDGSIVGAWRRLSR